MSLRGSKKTSKMEPKVVSGRGFFDFGQSLISCNTTRVLLDFHGFRLPRGGQKTIKKRSRKKNVKKAGPEPILCENGVQNGLRFVPRILPQFPPEGSLFRLGPQGRPKGAQGCQKDAKRPQNGPKRTQKGTKKVPKGSQRGMKIIFKIKITKIIILKK